MVLSTIRSKLAAVIAPAGAVSVEGTAFDNIVTRAGDTTDTLREKLARVTRDVHDEHAMEMERLASDAHNLGVSIASSIRSRRL